MSLNFSDQMDNKNTQNPMFRKQLNSSKWSCKTEGQAYPLTLADMDFSLYEPFKQSLVEQITKLNNLTYKDRSWKYFDALIEWYRKHHNVELRRQYFVECPSICNLIACCIMAFTEEKQKVLVFTPVYSFYMKSIQKLKREVVACELKQVPIQSGDNAQSNMYRYEFDLNNFAMKMDQQKPGLIILCHPHNPSGKVFNRQELDFIVKKAQQHNSYILSDQIMGDFTLYPSNNDQTKQKNKLISLSTYTYNKIIVGNSISKVFNCESVQGGYGIILCEQTRKKYDAISHDAFKLLTNEMSLILTPIVYGQNGPKWISYINQMIDTNFSLFKETFKSQKYLKIFEVESSYLTTIEFDFAKIGISPISNKYLAAILGSFGIYFTNMQEYFYPPTERNLFRISIAIHPNEFKKFVAKFKICLEDFISKFSKEKQINQLAEIRKSKL